MLPPVQWAPPSLLRTACKSATTLTRPAAAPPPAGQLADELVAREFAAPQRPRPCQAEADECVRCYADNAADPLACGPAVQAYSACAKAAWHEALQRAV